MDILKMNSICSVQNVRLEQSSFYLCGYAGRLSKFLSGTFACTMQLTRLQILFHRYSSEISSSLSELQMFCAAQDDTATYMTGIYPLCLRHPLQHTKRPLSPTSKSRTLLVRRYGNFIRASYSHTTRVIPEGAFF